MTMESDFTTEQVAEILQVSVGTVRLLIKSGSLTAYRLSGNRSQYRVTREALQDYRERQQRASDPWIRTQRRRKSA